MHTESEDDQDFSTELLFERAFIATALNYNGVRVEPASLNGKAMTLMANAVFNSAFVVGEWIDRGFLDFADGHSVLELGAGTGLPTLRLLQQPFIWLKRAVITDYPAEEIMVTLEKNAKGNGAISNPNVHVCGLDWYSENDIQHVLQVNDGHAYDLIIAADLLWYTDAHAALVECISKTLRKPPAISAAGGKDSTPRALVPSGKHAKRENVRGFLDLVKKAGLKWREIDPNAPFEVTSWNKELESTPQYEWHGSLDIYWEGEGGTRQVCTAENLAERKETVYAFELQWA